MNTELNVNNEVIQKYLNDPTFHAIVSHMTEWLKRKAISKEDLKNALEIAIEKHNTWERRHATM